MTQAYLFVYGTLRQGAEHGMHELLCRHADFAGAATCQGRLYRIDSYPGLVPSDDPAHRVKGEVYALRESSSLLTALDAYEECLPGSPEPTEYVRSKRAVVLEDGRTLMAWVYVYNRPVEGLREIVSGDFLEKSHAGA